MFRAILYVLGLAVALTVLALLFGYIEYRKSMNACLNAGGIVVKTATGIKCVPRGKIQYL